MADAGEYQVSKDWHNNTDNKPLIFDFFEDFLYLCIFYPAVALLLHFVNKGTSAYLHAFLLLPVFFAMTLSRRFSKKIYIYALLQVLLLTALVFLPFSLEERLILLGSSILAVAVSGEKIAYEVKRSELSTDPRRGADNRFMEWYTPILGSAFLYIVYLVSLALDVKAVITFCFFSFAIFLIAFRVYSHTSGTYALKFWEHIEQNGTSRNFTAFFTVLLAAGIGFVSFIVYEIVYLTGLDRLDGYFLNYLKNGRTIKDEIQNAPDLPEAIKTVEEAAPKKMPKVAAATGLEGFIYKLFIIALWVGVAFLALYILAAILRWIFRIIANLRKNINEETESVFSIEDAKDQLAEKFRSLRMRIPIAGTSNRSKIRRLYYKVIHKASLSGKTIRDSDAPFEICEKVKNKTAGDLSAATGLYEKARYAEDDCTPEDVEAAKQYLKS